MMERFQDAEFSRHCCPQKTVTIPRIVCVLYLLFIQPRLSVLFTHPTPVSPCLAQRGSDMRGSTVPVFAVHAIRALKGKYTRKKGCLAKLE